MMRLSYGWVIVAWGTSWAASGRARDRKSTRLNSSHANISYAVFCLKKIRGHRAAVSAAPPSRRAGRLLRHAVRAGEPGLYADDRAAAIRHRVGVGVRRLPARTRDLH